MHPFVELAKKTIQEYITNNKKIEPPSPLPKDMQEPSGLFVCIKKRGDLRGCIGTIKAVQKNLALEIIDNTISAAVRDSRFPAVKPEELDDLELTVDVLCEPEPVDSIDDLDAKLYGVVVTAGYKKSLLLPDIEGVNSPEEQIAICRRKGGIGQDEEIKLMRFTVHRFK